MFEIFLIVVSFALGGILKGATGVGAPLIAVPVIAMFFGVPMAVTIFAVPNFAANVWQAWKYRSFLLPASFTAAFAIGGALGVFIGTQLLVRLSSDLLALIVAAAVLVYVVFKLSRPTWVLSYAIARKVALIVGTLGGVLFGASGLSAPVILSFLNALKLKREQFIGTISVLFLSMGAVQIPMLFYHGLMDGTYFVLSTAALIPILAFMPLGVWLARFISREVFDRIILGLLVVLALKLVIQSV